MVDNAGCEAGFRKDVEALPSSRSAFVVITGSTLEFTSSSVAAQLVKAVFEPTETWSLPVLSLSMQACRSAFIELVEMRVSELDRLHWTALHRPFDRLRERLRARLTTSGSGSTIWFTFSSVTDEKLSTIFRY